MNQEVFCINAIQWDCLGIVAHHGYVVQDS